MGQLPIPMFDVPEIMPPATIDTPCIPFALAAYSILFLAIKVPPKAFSLAGKLMLP